MAMSLDGRMVAAVLRDRYELVEEIGRGSASVVYRARDRLRTLSCALDSEIAIKLLTFSSDYPMEHVELLHREGLFLNILRHPNIIRGYGSDTDGKSHFLVLELLRGRNLVSLLRDAEGHRLGVRETFQILSEIADALLFMHRSGLVHGDIKPGNVFLTSSGDVKLIDLSSARITDVYQAGVGHSPRLTKFSSITPIYASREMLQGVDPKPADDVFSLAVLAYVMLTGRHPYDGCPADKINPLQLHAIERPVGLTSSGWSALKRGLAVSRQDRYASVDVFMRELTPRENSNFLRNLFRGRD